MKRRRRHTRENKKRRSHNHNEPENKEEEEEKKSGSHNHNEDNIDRLSDLPDCVLIHILSFLNAEDAVRTCILSSTWRHLWKHLPSLTLYSSHFMTVKRFLNFVNWILYGRHDSSTALNALDFKLWGIVEPDVLESIVSYAASLNVNRLRLSFDTPIYGIYGIDGIRQLPSSLFSCRSLTSLDIRFKGFPVGFPNSLNLPALTYLKLYNLSFDTENENDDRVEPFSTFNRLNTLILYKCIVWVAKPLCISSTTLLNLSIHTSTVVFSDIELFAPSLCTFAISCESFQKLFGSHLSSIKQVSIIVYNVEESSTLGILNWLTAMTDIKSLTVTPKTLQALSLFPDIFKLKLTSWCKLKSLKLNLDESSFFLVDRRNVEMELASGKSWEENSKLREVVKAGLRPKYSSILDGMIDFLLQNSPSAKVEILLES